MFECSEILNGYFALNTFNPTEKDSSVGFITVCQESEL